jgi:hypothetical protein
VEKVSFIFLFHKINQCKDLKQDEPACQAWAWVDLLLMASGHPHEAKFKNGQTEFLEVGDVPLTDRMLVKRWKWSRGKVRRFLAKLVANQSIIIKRTGKRSGMRSIWHIPNFAEYQGKSASAKQRRSHSRSHTRSYDDTKSDPYPIKNIIQPIKELPKTPPTPSSEGDQVCLPGIETRKPKPETVTLGTTVVLTIEQRDKLQAELNPGELDYWVDQFEYANANGPRRYKDFVACARNWRKRRLGQREEWDPELKIWAKPKRKEYKTAAERARDTTRDTIQKIMAMEEPYDA